MLPDRTGERTRSVILGLRVGFLVLSRVAGHRLALRAWRDPRIAGRGLMSMTMLSLLFTVAGIVLLNQPMGTRHGP